MSKEDAMSKEELSQDVAIEPIIFRSTIKDERQIIYVAQRWPEYASIDPCALRFPGISIRDDGMIVLTCENGFAIYKLAKTQISEPAPRSLDRWVVCRAPYGITVELVESDFSAAPLFDQIGGDG
jgi:hypothetical protein